MLLKVSLGIISNFIGWHSEGEDEEDAGVGDQKTEKIAVRLVEGE